MKNLYLIFLFFTFCGLSYLNHNFLNDENNAFHLSDSSYSHEIFFSKNNLPEITSSYKFDVFVDSSKNLIEVNQKIVWYNKTNFQTNKIFLEVKSANYKLSSNGKILSIKNINNREVKYSYPQKSNIDSTDSTLIMIKLPYNLLPGDSLLLKTEYKLNSNFYAKILGYSNSKDFLLIYDWFPKLIVFNNGKLDYNYSDFSDYEVKINFPASFEIGSNLLPQKTLVKQKIKVAYFQQNSINNFVWFLYNDMTTEKALYKRDDGSEVIITAYIKPERDDYLERYIEAIKNSLKFLENNIGKYPYKSINLVALSKKEISDKIYTLGLIAFNANLISPVETHIPENVIINKMASQYFGGIVASNFAYEAWISKGLSSFLEVEILDEFYGEGLHFFNMVSYYPIYGVDFLSYNEIPLIYSLGFYPYKKGTKALSHYYKSLKTGCLADTSYKLPTKIAYDINSIYKPQLMLLTLENLIGKKKTLNIIKEFYSRYLFKHPTGSNFMDILQEFTEEDFLWFTRNFYENSYIFDYSIDNIKQISRNKYSVICKRLGDGIFPNKIKLYTDKDTLERSWNGVGTWKELIFITPNQVEAAEIDHDRVNLFDVNFANNSYTVKPQYFLTFSLSLRWLFWVQNMLMILGSIG